MKKKQLWITAAALVLFVAACVTVNVYFPVAEVEKTAEEIVKDVYGEEGGKKNDKAEAKDSSRVPPTWLGPRQAHAQDATDVSNAAINALKSKIQSNHSQLKPYYDRGAVGITNDGLLSVRSTDGLGLDEVAKVKRLVQADNQNRKNLYREVAKALDVSSDQVGRIQKIFADQWRQRAQSGWWIQTDSGGWKKK
jgi:uncharacterized protein YdbL (DUF1318 family)